MTSCPSFRSGVEKMLEGELDGHLGYNKNEQTDNDNARNGYGKKKIKTQYGESEIKVPRDRDSSFNPMIVPKRENMVEGLEEVIVSLYAKGMSVSDMYPSCKYDLIFFNSMIITKAGIYCLQNLNSMKKYLFILLSLSVLSVCKKNNNSNPNLERIL